MKGETNLEATLVETVVGIPSDAGSNPAASTELEAKEVQGIVEKALELYFNQ